MACPASSVLTHARRRPSSLLLLADGCGPFDGCPRPVGLTLKVGCKGCKWCCAAWCSVRLFRCHPCCCRLRRCCRCCARLLCCKAVALPRRQSHARHSGCRRSPDSSLRPGACCSPGAAASSAPPPVDGAAAASRWAAGCGWGPCCWSPAEPLATSALLSLVLLAAAFCSSSACSASRRCRTGVATSTMGTSALRPAPGNCFG
jgi:hypothetical protein